MSQPKVSIIIPVYNEENFIVECLNSVVDQTLRELEIICVDDGSTDHSLEILKEYEKNDSRIKVISKENSGYGSTMNIGTIAALGEYVGIVESDDFIEKEMFDTLYQAAKKFDADIVKSDHYTFSTQEGRQKKEYIYACSSLDYYNKIINASQYEEIYDFAMMNWTGIYRTNFLKGNNIAYNETPGASFQDNGFWFQTITLAKKIVFINKAFYYYRQDNPNSSINNKEKVFCICDEYNYIDAFLEAHPEEYDKHFPTYVKKKFFNYRHSYDRIADEYKMDFLLREQKEYAEDLERLKDKKGILDSWVLGQMNRIVDSPQLYFYESSLEKLKKEAMDTHETWMKLINSKEFLKGQDLKTQLRVKK